MLVKHYRDLWVYQRAFKAAMRIFELSKSWPREERYSLTDQIRRSSRSVCGAVAEAWRKRRYEAHFVSKLSDADSEAAETQNWLAFALHCNYLPETDFRALDDEYDAISAGLVSMMDNPSPWCGPAHVVREEYGSVGVWEYGRDERKGVWEYGRDERKGACEYGSLGEKADQSKRQSAHSDAHTPTRPHSHTASHTPPRPHAHTPTPLPGGKEHA